MTFHLVGTGNIAWFLAKSLTESGHVCKGIYGRDPQKALELAETIQCPVHSLLEGITDDADCCIMAISDHAIAPVIKHLSFTNCVLIHTAGAVDMDILSPAAEHHGVLWPVYSILKHDLPNHKNIPAVWEAATIKAKDIIETIGASFSNMVFFATSEQRKWLHLSAVLSNNFTNHLLTICEDICNRHDIPFPLLFPITVQTLERITSGNPHELQTGPARRGDKQTQQAQLHMLSENPYWQQLYAALSTSIEKMYRPENTDKGLNA